VARLPAERRRLHQPQRSIARHKDDHDVYGGERQDEEHAATREWSAEVQHWPVAGERSGTPQPPPLEPDAEWDADEPDDDEERQRDEDDQPSVRIVEQADQQSDQERDEDHGGGRGHQRAGDREGMSREGGAARHAASYLRLSM
jgi:hypothetical protein